MNPQLMHWALAVRLLIGFLVLAVALFALLIVCWTFAKMSLFRRRQRAALAAYRRRRVGPDGRALPPSAPGLCDRCQRAFSAVLFLSDGQRLCPACHAIMEQTAEHPAHAAR